mmetsp:Transcript_76448/g.248009  ORF Transcript_76448/g.248009 Transcript_76448/m.248009 type:complete len:247 (-) Transcript_76448:2458-3198(-)
MATVELGLQVADVGQLGQLFLLKLAGGRELVAQAEEDVAVFGTLKVVLPLDLWHVGHGRIHGQGLGTGPLLSVLRSIGLIDIVGRVGPLHSSHEGILGALARGGEPAATQAFLAALQDLCESLEGSGIADLEAAAGHGHVVRQSMEALRRIWHGECITGWLVEEAVHIRAQRIKGALADIGLDRLVKSLAGLHRDVAVAEEDVVAHETTHGQLSERGLLGDQLGEERLAIVLQIMGVEVVVALAAE